MKFRDLHHNSSPLLLANVWDAASAQCAHVSGMQAIGTSSAAMASLLGYSDGQGMPFGVLHTLVSRIAQATPLPLNVDLEAGYGSNVQEIVQRIQALSHLGVVGINLEDSYVNSSRQLESAEVVAARLSNIRAGLESLGVNMFINLRTDTFLLGLADARAETLRRGSLYAKAGADGLFVPCIHDEADIAAVVQGVPIPLNVMCVPKLPSFERLGALGVRRISMGNFLFERLQAQLRETYDEIRHQGSFASVFA
jgi:2-methylisocitrate lyase-like PEP mutase family enzyme